MAEHRDENGVDDGDLMRWWETLDVMGDQLREALGDDFANKRLLHYLVQVAIDVGPVMFRDGATKGHVRDNLQRSMDDVGAWLDIVLEYRREGKDVTTAEFRPSRAAED